MASYDPRNGEVGQNCVLPEYRGMGYGKKQIEEVLRILKDKGLKKAVVTTSEHPFFILAQKMYKSLGFEEIGRRKGGPDTNYGLIDFTKEL